MSTKTNPITADDIIKKFELQVDDITDLSEDEELGLLNDKLQDVYNDRPWICLRKPATGALAYDTVKGLWYAPQPADFKSFAINNLSTDNSVGVRNNAMPMVVFVGSARAPWQLVNYADREQYRNRAGYAYLDPIEQKVYMTYAPSDTGSYLFDYIHIPADLEEVTDEPTLIPVPFRKMLSFAMAADNDIIQRSSIANSQQAQNQAKYEDVLGDMQLWDADQYLN